MIRLFLTVDKVIRSLKWIALVGYPVGTVCDVISVITIMVQYKRMSLNVSTETNHNNGQREVGEQGNSQWMEFQDQYPVINAYVFYGNCFEHSRPPSTNHSSYHLYDTGLVVPLRAASVCGDTLRPLSLNICRNLRV